MQINCLGGIRFPGNDKVYNTRTVRQSRLHPHSTGAAGRCELYHSQAIENNIYPVINDLTGARKSFAKRRDMVFVETNKEYSKVNL
jgi:hypothetical protein